MDFNKTHKKDTARKQETRKEPRMIALFFLGFGMETGT
jgi:hypothetical protein